MTASMVKAVFVVSLRFRWEGDYKAWIRTRGKINRFLRRNKFEWIDTDWVPDEERKGDWIGLEFLEKSGLFR